MKTQPRRKPGARDKAVASVVACLVALHSVAAVAATQGGSEGITSIINKFAQGDAAAKSAAEMAKGTDNSNQGQQMQNMAQMAMGAMQILQALLGMMAAAQAGKNAGQAAGNSAGLSDLGGWNPNGTGATAATPTNTNPGGSTTGTSETGTTGTPGGTVKISPSDLRTGTIGAAMNSLEQNYGLPRDQVAAALAAGTGPQDILSHATKNTPSSDMLNKIADGLAANYKASSQDAVNRILASANGVNTGGAGTGSPSAGDGSVDMGKAGGMPKPKSSADIDAQLDELLPGAGVSPEIKAAMAAKAAALKAEKERQEANGWNIFQLVHSRYQKLETMLYGRVDRTNASPTAGIKGF